MRPSAELIPNVRKIAVLRANALGDFIVATPALQALRVAYPMAEIALLGKAWHAQFLSGRPGPIDRVIVAPPSSGVNETSGAREDARELERFFARMREERFDLAIQLHGGGRNSNPFVSRLGAALTVGLKAPDALPLDRWIPYVYFQHEALRYLEVVRLVGAKPVTLAPRISLTTSDRAEAEQRVAGVSRPFVALHPGASDPKRRWPAACFARVGDALAEAGACVVLVGDEHERALTEAVAHTMRADSLNLAGRLTLGGLAGLLAQCRLVVANDSGPRHLAEAVGTATVGLYWCFNLVNAGPLFRARHHPLVSWNVVCPICGQNCSFSSCACEASLISDIAASEVIAAAVDLYTQEGVSRASSLAQV